MTASKHLRVLSFDFDNCLHDPDKPQEDILERNKDLLESLKKTNEKTIVLVGAKQQSIYADARHQEHLDDQKLKAQPSCFNAIKKISDKLGATFDPFLMADLYNNVTTGTTISLAKFNITKGFYNKSTLPHLYFASKIDWTKITLLYAQMHKIASEHQDEHIDFTFYEANPNTYDALYEYFHTYPALIPDKITLRLIHRTLPTRLESQASRDNVKTAAPLVFPPNLPITLSTDKPEYHRPLTHQNIEYEITSEHIHARNVIGGTGPINPDYYASIQKISSLCLSKATSTDTDNKHDHNVENKHDHNVKIFPRKYKPGMSTPDEEKTLKRFDELLKQLESKVKILSTKKDASPERQEKITLTTNLLENLKKLRATYNETPQTVSYFSQQCNTLISEARLNDIIQNRADEAWGIKTTLVQIFSLGLYKPESPHFFKTKTETILENLQNTLPQPKSNDTANEQPRNTGYYPAGLNDDEV